MNYSELEMNEIFNGNTQCSVQYTITVYVTNKNKATHGRPDKGAVHCNVSRMISQILFRLTTSIPRFRKVPAIQEAAAICPVSVQLFSVALEKRDPIAPEDTAVWSMLSPINGADTVREAHFLHKLIIPSYLPNPVTEHVGPERPSGSSYIILCLF